MPDYKEKVRSLQSKKQAVLGPAAVGKQDERNIVNPPPPMPGDQTPDVVREKYVKILKHDFTGKKWIVNNKERRANINADYQLVTGETGKLVRQKEESRKKELEHRRALSLAASSGLVDHIKERDNRKAEWDELDKGVIANRLMAKTVEDFHFASDEEFLASFGEKMRLLCDAELLSHEITRGDAPEGVDMPMLSGQLKLLNRIREAYENRIKIISSPYYSSIREEDLTGAAMDRLDNIAKGRITVDETLKSYAEAVVGWKKAGAELKGLGKDKLLKQAQEPGSDKDLFEGEPDEDEIFTGKKDEKAGKKQEEKAGEKQEEKAGEKQEEKAGEKKDEKAGEKAPEKISVIPAGRSVKTHSSDFFQMYAGVMQKMDQGKKYRMTMGPDSETLGKKYRRSFKERVSDRERAEKLRNPKSRLYQKAQNAKLLTDTVKAVETEAYDALNRSVTRQAFRVDKEDYHDLSMFMRKDQDEANRELVNLYLGRSVKQVGNNLQGQDVSRALDHMAEQLFSIDISALDLSNDTALVRHADKLEKLAAQVSAFERMAAKHHYTASLNKEQQKRLNERITALGSIAAYYQGRKEIITDETYKTHYNDELSIDPEGIDTRNGTVSADQQRALGEKLVKSLVLGRTMMRLNGIPVGRGVFGGDSLTFRSERMNAYYTELCRTFLKKEQIRKTASSAHLKKDTLAEQELHRLTARLRELNKIDPIKEQQEIQADMKPVQDRAVIPVQRPESRLGGWAKFKNRLKLGFRWLTGLPAAILFDLPLLFYSGTEKALFEGGRKKTAQEVRRHDMVPGRKDETFRDEIVRKDEQGEDIDIYSDTRRGPLVWEKLSAGDPEDPPEVVIMVKQGTRGSDAALTNKGEGHAMISLSYSRYNKTTKRKERYQLRMGFYPGNGIVKQTQMAMLNGAVIGGALRNDLSPSNHYDVARRYQVKPGDINKILREAEKYADKGYNYYSRNCTTFVVDMAKAIDLPIAKELQEDEMVFQDGSGLLLETGRGLSGPGFDLLGANAMSSRMNKADLSYHHFGQKMYTKEELDRYYETTQKADQLPVGYAPGPVGEALRGAGSGELTADLKEHGKTTLQQLNTLISASAEKIQGKLTNMIPEGQVTQEDNDIVLEIMSIGDGGLWKAREGDKLTTERLREIHKDFRNVMKMLNRYYAARWKNAPELNAEVMEYLSLCETALCFTDMLYTEALRKEVKGDAGILRYDFVNTKHTMSYLDEKGREHKIEVEPGVFEGYLLAGKTADEAIMEMIRLKELEAEEEEKSKLKNTFKIRTEREMEISRLRLTHDLARDFASANRYLLDKDEFTEKDIHYAFSELPAMEQRVKGGGTITKDSLITAPSIAYQGVILEQLFGGIHELGLDKLNELQEMLDTLDHYLAGRIREKPELFEMILKHWAEGKTGHLEVLTSDFIRLLIDSCITPALTSIDFDTTQLDGLTYMLQVRAKEVKQLIQTKLDGLQTG